MDACISTTKRQAARAIICIKGKLLMVQSKKFGEYKFPGGGINRNETAEQAVIREVKEETGQTVIVNSIKTYGKKEEVRKHVGKNEVFEQTSFYFTCNVDESSKSNPTPEAGYEVAFGYAPIWVTPAEAIAKNELLLDVPDIPWVARDLAVLKELVDDAIF